MDGEKVFGMLEDFHFVFSWFCRISSNEFTLKPLNFILPHILQQKKFSAKNSQKKEQKVVTARKKRSWKEISPKQQQKKREWNGFLCTAFVRWKKIWRMSGKCGKVFWLGKFIRNDEHHGGLKCEVVVWTMTFIRKKEKKKWREFLN